MSFAVGFRNKVHLIQTKKRILLNDVRNHNHELLEIILEARELSTENKVVEILTKALKVNKDRFGKQGHNAGEIRKRLGLPRNGL